MIARMATYTYTGDADDLGARAERGILPVMWDTRENAEAGNAAVADWVGANMAGELTNADIRFADVLFSTTLGVSTLG
jgi:hypothetical protein